MTPARTSRILAALAALAAAGALSACGHPAGNAAAQREHLAATSSPASSSPGRPSPPPVTSSPPPVAAPSASASPSPPPPVTATPPIIAVRLGAAFSPDSLRVSVGQQFLITVSSGVQASGLGVPAGCAQGAVRPVAGGLLTVRCPAGGGYLYTAEHPGSVTLSATVRPRCSPGQMCPQWISEPRLQITIT